MLAGVVMVSFGLVTQTRPRHSRVIQKDEFLMIIYSPSFDCSKVFLQVGTGIFSYCFLHFSPCSDTFYSVYPLHVALSHRDTGSINTNEVSK